MTEPQAPNMDAAIMDLIRSIDFVNTIEKVEIIGDKTGKALAIRFFHKNSERVDTQVFVKPLPPVNSEQGDLT